MRLAAVLAAVLLAVASGILVSFGQEEVPLLEPVAPPPPVGAKPPDDVQAPTPFASMPEVPQPPVPLQLFLAPEWPLPERWQRHAVPVTRKQNAPRVAIVLDDLGLDRPAARRAIALPAPLTLSLMTYADNLEPLAASARAAGHELMLHVPMEPYDPSVDPGPRALRRNDPEKTLRENLRWGLERLEGYVGINNHMGSAFTSDAAAMRIVLSELRTQGLLFLDSRTAGGSKGLAVARELGVPAVARDIFLDHKISRAFIRQQLQEVEMLARQKGAAIAIGHPYRETLDILAEWLPGLSERGLQLVPVSALVPEARENVPEVLGNLSTASGQRDPVSAAPSEPGPSGAAPSGAAGAEREQRAAPELQEPGHAVSPDP